MNSDAVPVWLLVAAAIALLPLWAGMRTRRRRRLINDIPTSKSQGVFIGFVELKGQVRDSHPLTATLSGRPCSWYRWSAEEHWSRTVTSIGPKGQIQTRRESGWRTVSSGGEQKAFFLEDDTGGVRIIPTDAKVEPLSTFNRECTPIDALYYSKGPREAVSNSDHRRRFTEESLPVGAPIYVVGQSRERRDVVAAEIAQDPAAPMFLISTRTEEKVTLGLGWQALGWEFLALVILMAGAFASMDSRPSRYYEDPDPTIFAWAAGGFALAWILGWTWMAYNALVNLRQRVNQAWSLVDVELKRRNDLIPRLLETVRGMKDYEGGIQAEVAELRNQMQATPPGQAGPDHHGCAVLVRGIAERYPELKAQDSFLRLQKELSTTEQRIALARAYFNDIATFHNTRLDRIPDRFLAGAAGLRPRALMTAADFERAPVSVAFGSPVAP